MYEHGTKKNARETSVQTASDRRNADRHSFTAAAEVIELSSGARFATRTTDLGPGGCFVDTLVPFPVGAKVRVTVRKGQTNFETTGCVVYSQTGLGMGIAFDTLEHSQRQALENWLMELAGVRQHAAASATTREQSAAKKNVASPPLVRLVQLMISKGLITEAEGASIMYDPFL